jgi:alpha,alpha-trehalase
MNIYAQIGKEFLPLLDDAEKQLTAQLHEISGVLVERKRFSVAIHYRNVNETLVKQVQDAVEGVINNQTCLKLSSGKKIFEVQPSINWNKGKSLLWLLEEMNLNSIDVVPFFIGDDATDEDAFESLSKRGIGIVVMENSRPTAAHYSLKNPYEVEKFIRRLLQTLKGE